MSKNLKLLEQTAEEFRQFIPELSFGAILRGMREALGLKQYRVCELCQIYPPSLKRMEKNKIQMMPDRNYIRALCDLYGLEEVTMFKKAMEIVEDHMDGRRRKNSIKVKDLKESEKIEMARNALAKALRNGF